MAQEAKETGTPYTELTRADHKWLAMDSTCVENQVFYFFAEDGTIAFCQVIYSNVAYVIFICSTITRLPMLVLAADSLLWVPAASR